MHVHARSQYMYVYICVSIPFSGVPHWLAETIIASRPSILINPAALLCPPGQPLCLCIRTRAPLPPFCPPSVRLCVCTVCKRIRVERRSSCTIPASPPVLLSTVFALCTHRPFRRLCRCRRRRRPLLSTVLCRPSIFLCKIERATITWQRQTKTTTIYLPGYS